VFTIHVAQIVLITSSGANHLSRRQNENGQSEVRRLRLYIIKECLENAYTKCLAHYYIDRNTLHMIIWVIRLFQSLDNK